MGRRELKKNNNNKKKLTPKETKSFSKRLSLSVRFYLECCDWESTVCGGSNETHTHKKKAEKNKE